MQNTEKSKSKDGFGDRRKLESEFGIRDKRVLRPEPRAESRREWGGKFIEALPETLAGFDENPENLS